MDKKIIIPAVGESVTEGIIGVWLKKEGDAVSKGDGIFEFESDKATVTVAAEFTGVLHIDLAAGSQVSVGAAVGRITEGAVAAKPKEEPKPAPKDAPKKEEAKPTPAPVAKEAPKPIVAASTGNRSSETKPLTPLRKQIAKRLVESKLHAAHLSTFNEIDMGAVKELRDRLKGPFEDKHGVRLGFMSFFVTAVTQALKAYPLVNSYVDTETVTYNNFYDISVAVSTEKGLITPVLRDADQLSFAGIEGAIANFGARAKAKTIMPDELVGGTFTISNGGVFGSLLSTPIPNPPQTAVLGLHTIQDRPVARNGQVVIRPMMYVALTYDHRILDGKEAIGFLKHIKDLIEDPARLLLEA